MKKYSRNLSGTSASFISCTNAPQLHAYFAFQNAKFQVQSVVNDAHVNERFSEYFRVW